jgi:hypothetical protein
MCSKLSLKIFGVSKKRNELQNLQTPTKVFLATQVKYNDGEDILFSQAIWFCKLLYGRAPMTVGLLYLGRGASHYQ